MRALTLAALLGAGNEVFRAAHGKNLTSVGATRVQEGRSVQVMDAVSPTPETMVIPLFDCWESVGWTDRSASPTILSHGVTADSDDQPEAFYPADRGGGLLAPPRSAPFNSVKDRLFPAEKRSASLSISAAAQQDASTMGQRRPRLVEPAARAVDVDPLTDDIIEAVRDLADLTEGGLGAGSQRITPVQYRALVTLSRQGPLNQTQLSERLLLQPPTLTRLCDRLVRKGLIVRRPSQTSGREIRLSVSPRGARVLNAVLAARRKAINDALSELTPRQRSSARDALVTIAEAAVRLTDKSHAGPLTEQ